MATYVYETIPVIPGVPPDRFELQQSMGDPALTRHPATGEPVRRIITGGYGLMGVGEKKATPAAASHCCGSQCGCCSN